MHNLAQRLHSGHMTIVGRQQDRCPAIPLAVISASHSQCSSLGRDVVMDGWVVVGGMGGGVVAGTWPSGGSQAGNPIILTAVISAPSLAITVAV
jgi:hypothetical protein